MTRALAGLVGVVLSGCLGHGGGWGPPRRLLAQIDHLEASRSPGQGQLERWAGEHPSPIIRRRALVALGRLQSAATAPVILTALEDPDPSVREAAAVALGLLGLAWEPVPDEARARWATALTAAEQSEPALEVRQAQAEALGRVGGPVAAQALVDLLRRHPVIAARAAVALGVALKAGTPAPAGAFEALAGLADHADPNVRFPAVWALAVGKIDGGGRRELLVKASRDPMGPVRQFAARGLAGDVAARGALEALLQDPDPAVASEAVRALVGPARGGGAGPVMEAPEVAEQLAARARSASTGGLDGAVHPWLALSQAALPAAHLSALPARVRELEGGRSVGSSAERVQALSCLVDAARSRVEDVVPTACLARAKDPALALAGALSSWAELPPSTDPAHAERARAREVAVAPFLAHEAPRVRAAALRGLKGSGAPSTIARAQVAVASDDLEEAVAAAELLGATHDAAHAPLLLPLLSRTEPTPEWAPTVAEALAATGASLAVEPLRAWLASPHASVRMAAAQALTTLEGHPVRSRLVARDAEPLDPPAAGTRLRLELERGVVELVLFGADAPRNTAALVALADRGFFDGLTFHRVVPGFVVQGGDPRGDGEGGPGFTLPCEVSPRRYTRGTVGMALSGKDTGGSQFFVTLAPQPHLEGRYTVVGEVVRGLEVLDGVLPGEVMRRVTVIDP